jgi:hypothetical protein
MDGIGYFNIGLVSQDIRPLWLGMKFWGPAVTMRCVPANKPMWTLESTQDIVNAHGIWFEKMGHKGRGLNDLIKPGHVVVTDVGGAPPVGVLGGGNGISQTSPGGGGHKLVPALPAPPDEAAPLRLVPESGLDPHAQRQLVHRGGVPVRRLRGRFGHTASSFAGSPGFRHHTAVQSTEWISASISCSAR